MPAVPELNHRKEKRFFTAVALGLIVIVFTGFFRTYYLSPLYFKDRLPALVQAHGAVMTAWYAMFLLQVRLVAAHRVELHRRLGYASLGLATLVVVFGTLVSIQLATDRLQHNPASAEGPFLLGIQIFSILLPFLVLYGAGLVNRRKPELHRRLMALAMFSTLGPAVVRLPFIPRHNIPMGIATSIALVLAFAGADWWSSGKLHKVTALGTALIIGATFAGAAFSSTSLWVGLVRRLML